MNAVATVTNIEPEVEVNFHESDGSKTKHRAVSVWVKSADEETQGSWTTIVRLYDKAIDEAKENGLTAGSTVGIEIRPNYRRKRDGEYMASITNRIISVL